MSKPDSAPATGAPPQPSVAGATPVPPAAPTAAPLPAEHGGPQGPEPTRFGDWERNGRCSDF